MNKRTQEKRDTLRTAITREVERHWGHAEDVHDDYITVDVISGEVGFQSHLIEDRELNTFYYDVLDLIERDGCWFKPDKMAIEAVVQSLFPCQEVADFALNLKNTIIKFLDKEKPASTRQYKVIITIGTNRIICNKAEEYDEDDDQTQENDIDPANNPDEFVEQELQWVCYDEYPMRKFVRIVDGDYFFDDYQLTKATLNCIEV